MTLPNALCVALAFCLSLFALPLAAAPLGQTLKGEAKASYEQGKLAYHDGDFQGALSKFEQAYRAAQDPRLLWNMAACYKGMRRYARVLNLLDRYTKEGGELVTAADRTEANELRKALEPFVGELTLRVKPAGAEIFIDDERVNETPLVLDLGPHRLRVHKRGFRERIESLRIDGGKSLTMDIALSPSSGTLDVRAGAEETIVVDKKRRGTGAWRGRLQVGVHDVEIRGDETRRRRVRIEEDKVTTARFAPPEEGGLPVWVWIAGGAVLSAAAIAVTTYFVVRSLEPEPPSGTLGTFELP